MTPGPTCQVRNWFDEHIDRGTTQLVRTDPPGCQLSDVRFSSHATFARGNESLLISALKQSLNAVSASQMPRLKDLDTTFDVLMEARVMEFQHQEHLEVTGKVDPATLQRLRRRQAQCPAPRGRCVLVDLENKRLQAFNNGARDLDFAHVTGGSPDKPSTAGVFSVFKRLREHTSATYPDPPGNMNFSLFYNGDEALHQGPPNADSHGCIHVAPGDAEKLFDWAGAYPVTVIILMEGARAPKHRKKK
jgi:hypothetical protein